jgi:hypothetical protein
MSKKIDIYKIYTSDNGIWGGLKLVAQARSFDAAKKAVAGLLDTVDKKNIVAEHAGVIADAYTHLLLPRGFYNN